MRSLFAAVTFTAILAFAVPAGAATIFTFSLSDGSRAEPGSIRSFSFDPLGASGTLSVVKELDTLSPIILAATASGTTYPGATFAAYDGIVAPGSRLFEYTLINALFTSVQPAGGVILPRERFEILGETVTLTRGPASVPEPAILFLMATGAALAYRRRRRNI